MLSLGGVAEGIEEGRGLASAALDDGRALEKMREIIEAQGGNPAVLDDPALLPQAPVRRVVEAGRKGYISEVNAQAIGRAAVALGAGRATLDAVIDQGVGLHITAKPGDEVDQEGDQANVDAATSHRA